MGDFKQAAKAFPVRRWLAGVAHLRGDMSGTKFRCKCPHCGRKNAFVIYLDTGACRCYACADGGFGGSRWNGYGGLTTLISLFEGVTEREAAATVYSYAGVTDSPSIFAPSITEVEPELPEGTIPLIEVHDDHLSVRRLAERGLLHLRPHIAVCITGTYADRWILPVEQDGSLYGFEAKTFRQRAFPKSLFPTWMKTSQVVYMTRRWIMSEDFAVITESVFDAETLGSNAMGIFGSSLSDGQFVRLLQLRADHGVTRLVWFLDDDAWKKQARAIMQKTMLLFTNYVVTTAAGEDPNSLGSEECWRRVANATLVENLPQLLHKKEEPNENSCRWESSLVSR